MFLSKLFKTYRGLPRGVYILFIARMVDCIGNFVLPFMTLMLTTRIGIGADEVGFFLFLGSFLRVPGALIGGKLTDHLGRKKILITFMALGSSCFIPCAFFIDSPSAMHLVPWFLIMSSFFGSISGPAGSAMMNDLTIPANRKSSFSLIYLGINIGTGIGSLMAGFLFNNYIKFLFIGDTATTFIAIILMIIYVKETKPANIDIVNDLKDRPDEKAETGGIISAFLKRPVLVIFAFLNMLFTLLYTQPNFSLPLQVNSTFGELAGPQYYGIFIVINCVEILILTAFITTVTKKVRAIFNISLAGIFYGVGFGMLFFAKSFWLFALSTAIWTVGEILNATNVGAYIADHTPVTHRGRINSVMGIFSSTGNAISPYIIGVYITAFGIVNVWPAVFMLGICNSALIFFILGIPERRAALKPKAQEAQCG